MQIMMYYGMKEMKEVKSVKKKPCINLGKRMFKNSEIKRPTGIIKIVKSEIYSSYTERLNKTTVKKLSRIDFILQETVN